jgi:hypothetical protein
MTEAQIWTLLYVWTAILVVWAAGLIWWAALVVRRWIALRRERAALTTGAAR